MLDSYNSDTMLDSHNPGTMLDSYNLGTTLDLPHYHCNSVYVPWQAKDQRVTITMRNENGRSLSHPSPATVLHQAMGPFTLRGHLRSGEEFLSPRSESPVSMACDGWCRYNVFAHRTAVSIHSFSCCAGELTFAYQLSLSACSDPQRAREGARGSLTMVLCRYLGKQRSLQLI